MFACVAPVHPDGTLQWDQSLSPGSWSKRSEIRKESEEDKVKLLDMCFTSEANKELIHHKNSVFFEQGAILPSGVWQDIAD